MMSNKLAAQFNSNSHKAPRNNSSPPIGPAHREAEADVRLRRERESVARAAKRATEM